MIRKRIFTVILSVMIVICCVFEAVCIKNLQSDQDKADALIERLNDQISSQNDVIQNLSTQLEQKADEPMIRFYLPDDIYICESKGGDIYNNSVVYGINLNSYAFHWESSVGNSRSDRFEIAPMTAAGDYDVTLRIYDLQLNELVSKTTRLHIVADASKDHQDGSNLLVHSVIYSELDGEVPANLQEILAVDTEESEPEVAIVFPSAYEQYADLDGTMLAVNDMILAIREEYNDIPILIVEPSYPGNKADEEVQNEMDADAQKWAYAEKTMIFKLVSDLEKTYIEDDSVWIVPNALLTYSESDVGRTGDAIRGIISHLAADK